MKKFNLLALSVLISGATALSGSSKSFAEEATTSESQGISLTIYNQNFGVVKDIRSITLKDGVNFVRFSDVASQIDPTSVSLQSLTAPNSLVVREQNYQYDLIDPTTILSKSIGKTLKFRQQLENGSVREYSGTLLNSPQAVVASPEGSSSTRYQGLVVKTDSGVVLNPVGQIELAELPPGLISKPSLVWKLETNKPGVQKTEVAYQTQGINWKADYVAILNKDDDHLDLNSWVTLDNKSGATYPNASLKLLAGDVHRVTPQVAPMAFASGAMAMEAAPQQFAEQSFAEYHLYTLQGKTDVKDNETKQMSLFNADNVPVRKLFIYEPEQRVYSPYSYGASNNGQQKVQVKIEVENSAKNHMGMPMPKGKVRVYKRDQDGALQFVGEDEIDHTSKDEKIRVYIGDAFDLVGERKVMKQENISDRVRRVTYEVSLRNHKDSPVSITYVDHPYGDWNVLSNNQTYNRKDANTLEFTVQIPANGETKINYQVETRW